MTRVVETPSPAVNGTRGVLPRAALGRIATRWGAVALFAALTGLARPVLAAAQYDSPLAPTNVLQVTLGLAAVLATILVSAWFLRRTFRGHAGAHGHIKIISGVAMGPREKLVLVQVGKRQLLLGVAPGRIQTLHLLEEPLPVAAEVGGSPTFAAHLARTLATGRVPAGGEAGPDEAGDRRG